MPKWRRVPATEGELIDALKLARGVVRAVGSGHSFSAAVPTDDTLIATELLSGLVDHDQQKLRATLRAGTRLSAVGPLLDAVGQALPNMPDMDYPALGGSIVNSVHATGAAFTAMGGYVTDLRLVTPAGDLIECSERANVDIFKATLASVGCLGIVSAMTLQNQAPFALTEVNRVERLEDVLAEVDERRRAHRHFELFAIPYASTCITVATDLARPGDLNSGEEDPQAVNTLRTVFDSVSWIPVVGESLYDQLLMRELSGQAGTVRTGPSYRIFPHIRVVRFREMEYTVPAEAGPACLREIMQTIVERDIPLVFPIEYRYTRADDIWLSMFEGRDGCSISIHQYGDLDYHAPFAELEPIFWKYQGRPHWGKIHTLDAPRLAELYPRHWQDFQEVRKSLDPAGKMANTYVKTIFGT
jgi:FAD-linked oxidoreductase